VPTGVVSSMAAATTPGTSAAAMATLRRRVA